MPGLAVAPHERIVSVVGLEGSDVLIVVAEVAIAFAGFSSIVAIFVRRESGGWTHQNVLRLWQLLVYSLGAVFFALFPFVLFYCGLGGSSIWAASSALLGAFIAINTVLSLVTVLRALQEDESALSRAVVAAVSSLAVMALAVQVLNVLGVVFTRGFGGYLIGLLWLLVGSGFFFVRLLAVAGLRPLGK
jgi:hypothetical protein